MERKLLKRGLLLACLLALVSGNVLAQSFPAKPLVLHCPCVRGDTAVEVHFQTFAKIASKYLGQSVTAYIPARPTDAGVGAFLAAARPDGQTLYMLPITAFRAPHVQRVSWHPINDLTYIIGVASFTFGVVVKSDSQFKTLQNLIDFAKENPGRLFYGASQRGSTAHLAMEELGFKTGARFQPVHSTNANIVESVKALAEGRIMAISDNTEWGPYVDAGTHRLLATFGELRSRWNAPTTRELGFNVLAYSPFGIVAPRGLDPKLTKLLHDTFKRALDDPEYDKLLRQFELVDWYKSSEDYAEWAVDQFKFQRDLLKRTGIIR